MIKASKAQKQLKRTNTPSKSEWARSKRHKTSSLNLTLPQKSLLSKRPSFVPTPKDINWYELHKDFTKFVNQLRFKLKQSLLSQDYQNQQELSAPKQSQNHSDETVLLMMIKNYISRQRSKIVGEDYPWS